MDFGVKLQIMTFLNLFLIMTFLNETWTSDKNKTKLDINDYISENIPGNTSKILENVVLVMVRPNL